MISFKIYRPTIRVYYRDISTCDLSLPHDTGRPVSEERLRAIGIKFWKFTGSGEECNAKFRALGEEMGFGVKGSSQRYFRGFDQVQVGDIPKDIKPAIEFFSQDVLALVDALFLVEKGDCYFDFKGPDSGLPEALKPLSNFAPVDPEANYYIRVLVGPGEIYFIPQGTIMQAYPMANLDTDTEHDISIDELYKVLSSSVRAQRQ
ncbi:1,2-dihydroxy-3-keto-5-methylthiopentene dioxygenase [Marasmius sp. AFHP31]|nr:1,2-dihydroxy-3-keto-5-methylthiopentene dioxygenase [Marasmius sp. AFHP31]